MSDDEGAQGSGQDLRRTPKESDHPRIPKARAAIGPLRLMIVASGGLLLLGLRNRVLPCGKLGSWDIICRNRRRVCSQTDNARTRVYLNVIDYCLIKVVLSFTI